MLIKQEVKPSALLALSSSAKLFILFILCKACVTQCFNYHKEFFREHFDINVFAGSLEFKW